MKKLNLILTAVAVFVAAFSLKAQDGPYLEPLYDVEMTTEVYGVNATVLPFLFSQATEAVPRPLAVDIYTPVGDNNTERPLMLVFHTGNFLPFPANNGTGGTIKDSTVVEVCTRLAASGYVAASVDYRLGWNPVDPSQDVRKFFLINAAYRGVQDGRTAARFFRKSAVDGGNPYGIDPNKIGTWGIGTGGYIVAAMATLDEYQEVVIPKFLIDVGGTTLPMVIEGINGDINGTSVGITPPGYPLPVPAGDTLCYPNHVTYDDGTPISSEIQFTVNNGGALGDASWLDGNMAPWVSHHVPADPFAPYTEGTLTVPGTGDPADPSDDFPVVEVTGSFNIQTLMDEGGYNDVFNSINDDIEDYSDIAEDRSGGLTGMFPFPNDAANNSAPWDFYSPEIPTIPPNPAPEPELARTYWDSIFAYTAPRACVALNLNCNGVSSVEELADNNVNLLLAPNPAAAEVRVTTAENININAIELYDLNGKNVLPLTVVNATEYRLERNELANGVYFLKVHTDEGIAVRKLMFK